MAFLVYIISNLKVKINNKNYNFAVKESSIGSEVRLGFGRNTHPDKNKSGYFYIRFPNFALKITRSG